MQKEEKTQKEATYKGFPLFNELTDLNLRLRNRAVIMTNILEDSFVDGKCSVKGGMLITGYMNHIPQESRKELLDEFVRQANERGFKIK